MVVTLLGTLTESSSELDSDKAPMQSTENVLPFISTVEGMVRPLLAFGLVILTKVALPLAELSDSKTRPTVLPFVRGTVTVVVSLVSCICFSCSWKNCCCR